MSGELVSQFRGIRHHHSEEGLAWMARNAMAETSGNSFWAGWPDRTTAESSGDSFLELKG